MTSVRSHGTSVDSLRDQAATVLTLRPHALAFSLPLPASLPWLDPRAPFLFETGHDGSIHTMEIGQWASLSPQHPPKRSGCSFSPLGTQFGILRRASKATSPHLSVLSLQPSRVAQKSKLCIFSPACLMFSPGPLPAGLGPVQTVCFCRLKAKVGVRHLLVLLACPWPLQGHFLPALTVRTMN